MASVWEKHVDPASKCEYFFNRTTQEKRWTDPSAETAAAAATAGAGGDGWEEHKAPSGHVYYYQPSTGTKSWTPPPGAKEPAAPAAKTADWEEHVDPASRRVYYYQPSTGTKSWTKPGAREAAAATLARTDAPAPGPQRARTMTSEEQRDAMNAARFQRSVLATLPKPVRAGTSNAQLAAADCAWGWVSPCVARRGTAFTHETADRVRGKD